MTDYHSRHSGTIFSNQKPEPEVTDMIERAALATCSCEPCICKHRSGFEGMPCLARGRAAIEAMRTPTQEMAMVGHYVSGGELSDLQAKIVFIAMIEAALGKKP